MEKVKNNLTPSARQAHVRISSFGLSKRQTHSHRLYTRHNTSRSSSSLETPLVQLYLSISISRAVTQVLAPLINWQTPEERWGRLQVTRPWLLSRISWSTDALVPLTPPAARTDSNVSTSFAKIERGKIEGRAMKYCRAFYQLDILFSL